MSQNDISFVARLKDEVTGKLTGMLKSFDKLASNRGAQAILQGVGLSAGARMFTSIEGAISGAVDIMQDAIKNASDLRESIALSQQVFEKNAGAIETWASTASTAFGMTKKEALDTAAQFGNAFKNVGMSLDQTTDQAEQLTRLAADLGSAFNQSSQVVAISLRSGLLGESEPMRRFGVFLNEVQVEAKLAAMGIAKVNGEYTQGQKVMARYELIMEQTAGSQGMFGRDTGSLADAQKRLDAQLTDLSASIGEELLPALTTITQYASTELVPALKEVIRVAKELDFVWTVLGNATAPGLQKQLGVVGDESASLEQRAWGLANALGGIPFQVAKSAAHELSSAIHGTADAEKRAEDAGKNLAALSARFAASAGKGVPKIDALAGSTETAADAFARIRDKASAAAKKLKDVEGAVKDAMDALLESSFGPEELGLKLKGAKLEGGMLEDKLKDLKKLKPTKEVKADIVDTQIAIIENKKDVIRLEGELAQLGKITLNQHKANILTIGDDWGIAEDALEQYLIDLARVPGVKVPSRRGMGGGRNNKLADGGFAPVGWSGTVGEEGMERMIVTPHGALVTPMSGGGGSSSGGGAPAVIQLHLDGRVVAEVVDRNLYYKAARAPRSAYAG